MHFAIFLFSFGFSFFVHFETVKFMTNSTKPLIQRFLFLFYTETMLLVHGQQVRLTFSSHQNKTKKIENNSVSESLIIFSEK